MILLSILLLLAGSPFVNPDRTFELTGTIIDSETHEPVSFSYVHLEELNRNVVADVDGNYRITNIPSGDYTLSIHRIGYRTKKVRISIQNRDLTYDIKLDPSVLSTQAIDVVGAGESTSAHASRKVFGEDLRRNLKSTISATLSGLPGFDERSMGSAPGRPVIRGLGDERVLILQDGIRGGDVSGQSADHAVTIDPISAEEVEIARGPAALAYGSNAIAGVINVVKNQISSNVPSKVNGTFTFNGESVNTGASAAADFNIPYKDFALSLNLNGRLAGNTRTPAGVVENSDFSSTNNAIGLSYVQDWGYVGGAFTHYLNNYGVPPEPNGHEHGVSIEMRKYQYALKSELVFNSGIFKTLESDFSINNYVHQEIDEHEDHDHGDHDDHGSHGTEFGLVTTDISIKANHKLPGIFEEGSIGIWGEMEDYAIRGAGTPNSNSYKLGIYLIEEANIGKWHLEGGLRYDLVSNQPKETGYESSIGFIENRTFDALSGSVSAIYPLNNNFSVGTTLLRSFRAPSLEELYSEGPHLASYSYEVGNPDLEPERAFAKEIFVRYQSPRAGAEAAIYHNKFSNYLYAQDTGMPSNQNPNLNVYRFVGTEALLYGMEVSAEVQLLKQIVLSGSASYTIGRRTVSEQEQLETGYSESTRPLPQVPPLKIKSTLRYVRNAFEAGTRFSFAADQNRTGEFETPTDGYSVMDVFFQYRLNQDKIMHTFALNFNNILNQEYYNHLSRIKELRPEPGFNVSLLYRLYF